MVRRCRSVSPRRGSQRAQRDAIGLEGDVTMIRRLLRCASIGLLALPGLAADVIPYEGPLRHMYFKPATGEVREILGGATREGPNIVWDSTLESGFFSNLN